MRIAPIRDARSPLSRGGSARLNDERNAFPTTDRATLLGLVDAGPEARAQAVQHVLGRYLDPLVVYARGSSLRSLGDPVDMAQGFLADRLSRERYLVQWAESGLPLRQWLINGFHLFAKELRRKTRRYDGEETTTAEVHVELVPAADAAWARAVLTEACDLVSAELIASGHGRAWDIFRRHFIDGRPYGYLEHEFGLRPAAMAEASRRVTSLLRQSIRLILVRDGVAPDDIDAELRGMLTSIEGDRK